MAFDATILAVITQRLDTPTLMDAFLATLDTSLRQLSLRLKRKVSLREYVEHTKSAKIPRSIRIIEKRERETLTKKVAIDEDPYEGGVFVSPSYALACVCESHTKTNERVLAAWVSYAKLLTLRIPHVSDTLFAVGKMLSTKLPYEFHVLHATSRSRSEDIYALFVNGRNANPLTGKGALTTVKNTYGIDINILMDSIDRCLAITFAPYDITEAKAQLDKHKERIELFEREAAHLVFTDKQDGSNMTEKFRKENAMLLDSLNMRYETLLTALKTDPNGIVTGFQIEPYSPENVPTRERIFGALS